MADLWDVSPRIALRADEDFDLAAMDRRATPGYSGDKESGKAHMAERGELMSELQERLFADGKTGGNKSILLVIQGLDTAGKGGIARHVMGMVDPQGVSLAYFGVPTKEELDHHFLWRIKKQLPVPGKIGVFDRSHYEDVLVQRVDEIVEEEVWRKRYTEINNFEKRLVDSGTTVIKVALMCSKEEQAVRLLERIEREDKRWKYSTNDLDTRSKWDDYQEAYQDVFKYTSTEYAPWHVIPADRKWYARLAVTELLTQALIDLDLGWPKPRWQADVQRRKLLATVPEELREEILAEAQQAGDEAQADNDAIEAAIDAADDSTATVADDDSSRKEKSDKKSEKKKSKKKKSKKSKKKHKKKKSKKNKKK